jgi:hypothetical protein
MKRLACSFALVLAGCPAMTGTGTSTAVPPVQPVLGASCPAANDVYLASFLTHDDTKPATAGAAPGHTGWVVPLYDRKVDSTTGEPEYAAIDARTAESLGVPPAPTTPWLVVPGQTPCKATVASYYAAVVESSEPNITYGVELDGCPAPPKDQQDDAEAIVMVSEQMPTECQVVSPQPVASRLGETDADKHWQRPTKETPIPPALAAAIPPHDCKAPDCETLWTFGQVTVANRPVAWAGAVNWLTIPANTTAASQCDWKADTFAGFFVAGADGKAVKVAESQDHPLLLSSVLADRTGAQVVIAEGPGEYTTYQLAAGKATAVRHLVWLHLASEAYGFDERIGPSCEHEPDAPTK